LKVEAAQGVLNPGLGGDSTATAAPLPSGSGPRPYTDLPPGPVYWSTSFPSQNSLRITPNYHTPNGTFCSDNIFSPHEGYEDGYLINDRGAFPGRAVNPGPILFPTDGKQYGYCWHGLSTQDAYYMQFRPFQMKTYHTVYGSRTPDMVRFFTYGFGGL